MNARIGHRWKTSGDLDPIVGLCAAIQSLAETTEDPYTLIGSLIEGVAYTAHRSICDAKQAETAAAMLRLLIERIDAYRLAQSPGGTASSDGPSFDF